MAIFFSAVPLPNTKCSASPPKKTSILQTSLPSPPVSLCRNTLYLSLCHPREVGWGKPQENGSPKQSRQHLHYNYYGHWEILVVVHIKTNPRASPAAFLYMLHHEITTRPLHVLRCREGGFPGIPYGTNTNRFTQSFTHKVFLMVVFAGI